MDSSKKKINFGIIGLGFIATKMSEALTVISDKVNLYAVASRTLSKAEEFKKKFGFTKAYGSYQELAEDKDVDLVYIATPHSEHYKNTLLCLENNINCLVEKAFCSNYDESKKLVDFAKQKNLLLAEAMWTRYQPGINLIKDLMKTIGEIHSLEADFSLNLEHVERLKNPNLSGGALLDLGIYSLTMADMFFGNDILKLKLNTDIYSTGVDATDIITFTYKDKKMARVKCSFVHDKNSNYGLIRGSKGYIEFKPINAPEKVLVYDINGKLIKEEKITFIANAYEYQVLECIEAINNKKIETKSMPLSKSLQMMKWMDYIRSKANVVYPFETPDLIKHTDLEVWNIDNVLDEVNPWDRSNTSSVLEIYDINTKERKVLETFNKVIEAPNWSHDGKFLVYNSEGHVYKFDLETQKSTMINTDNINKINNDHIISSDDKLIAVSDETFGKSKIYILPIEGGTPKLVTQNEPSYLHGWKNDNKKMVYCAERNGEYDVYEINADGTNEVRLTDTLGLNDGPEYDSKGEYIYFNSVRSGLMQAWRMKSDGSNQEQLTFDNDLNTWFPHISPDNKKIVMLSYYKGDLWPGEHIPNQNVELRLMVDKKIETIAKLYGGQGTINVNSWNPDSTKFAFVSYKKN